MVATSDVVHQNHFENSWYELCNWLTHAHLQPMPLIPSGRRLCGMRDGGRLNPEPE